MINNEFLTLMGNQIRATRLKVSMTQKQLAQSCGFEKASLSRIESGKTNPTVLTLLKIGDALGGDIKDFFK